MRILAAGKLRSQTGWLGNIMKWGWSERGGRRFTLLHQESSNEARISKCCLSGPDANVPK